MFWAPYQIHRQYELDEQAIKLLFQEPLLFAVFHHPENGSESFDNHVHGVKLHVIGRDFAWFLTLVTFQVIFDHSFHALTMHILTRIQSASSYSKHQQPFRAKFTVSLLSFRALEQLRLWLVLPHWLIKYSDVIKKREECNCGCDLDCVYDTYACLWHWVSLALEL